MSYYQKYRSEKIEDLDLASVRTAFGTMMKSGEVTHAYLFVGPRGLGKTSSARILARLVNCEKNITKGQLHKRLIDPCGECDACVSIKNGSAVDVMEIDAASHRGIDDIRDLREKISLAPSVLPKKVYIIDEVHMLSPDAFNALLKTLEEPPVHAMFILCTTEAHKVPETIVSRCVRINFTKATTEELVRSLSRAVAGEGLKVGKGSLEELASGLDGSFREGHKLLEQLANRYKEITVENVREAMKLVGGHQVDALLAAVRQGDAVSVVTAMERLESEGAEVVNLVTKLLTSLMTAVRQEISAGKSPSRHETRLIRKLIRVVPKIKISPLPFLPLELVLTEAALKSGHTDSSAVRRAGGDGEKVVVKVQQDAPKKVAPVVENQAENTKSDDKVMSNVEFEQVVTGWQDLLSRLAPRNHSVAGLLRSAKPKEIKDKFLTIEVFYKFHKDQLEQEARRRIIEEEIAKMWGPISVKCVLGEKGGAKPVYVKNYAEARPPDRETVGEANGVKNDDGVKAAEEVFGV